MKQRKISFTLVEILTVVAIIGILAGISLGITSFVSNRNREVQSQTTVKMLEVILEQYKTKYGAYPAVNGKPGSALKTDVAFKIPLEPGENHPLASLFQDISYDGDKITGIKGVNISVVGDNVIICDGWGSPIIYVYPGVFNKTKYDLGSVGADRVMGDDPSGQKFLPSNIPSCGMRTNKDDLYRKYFGLGDDMTNFKRTEN